MPEGSQALMDVHAATRVTHQTNTPLFAGEFTKSRANL
jgi:hypothetical protein